MTTHAQATSMWCPFVRHGVSGGGSFNRGSEINNELNLGRQEQQWQCGCIASRCMAWRWVDGTFKDGIEKAHGYCGLAGSPR